MSKQLHPGHREVAKVPDVVGSDTLSMETFGGNGSLLIGKSREELFIVIFSRVLLSVDFIFFAQQPKSIFFFFQSSSE